MFLCSEAGGDVNEGAIFAGKRGLSPIIPCPLLFLLLLPYYCYQCQGSQHPRVGLGGGHTSDAGVFRGDVRADGSHFRHHTWWWREIKKSGRPVKLASCTFSRIFQVL